MAAINESEADQINNYTFGQVDWLEQMEKTWRGHLSAQTEAYNE